MKELKLTPKPPKQKFSARLVDWINMLYPFKKRDDIDSNTRFGEHLKHAGKGKNDEVVAAVKLCDEGLDIVSDRIVLANRMDALKERIAEAECYGRLTNVEVEDLKDLLARYMSLSKDSNALKYQVTNFDAGLDRMETLEKDAKDNLPEIKYAEERQRIFKQDINYLEGEKMVLEHANDRLKNAIDFVYKFSIAMVLLFGGVSLVLVFIYIFNSIQTIPVLAVTLVFVIIITGLLYALRNRLKYELALNLKKQNKAIELLNKKVAVYAHFTNYLSYSYRKYRVRSSDMLANNLQDYGHYKHLTKRLDSLRNIMSQTEAAIEFFLRDKGITTRVTNMEKFAGTINIDDKKQYYEELLREQAMIEKSLKRLDTRSAQIWDALSALAVATQNATDTATAVAIGGIIEDYTKKSEKIMAISKNEGTTAMDDAMDEVLEEEGLTDEEGNG